MNYTKEVKTEGVTKVQSNYQINNGRCQGAARSRQYKT